ncbi:uncharacterized protein LOC128210512 [Mya arenaria]|uniref:uncharacterized protein LOC128210512 n=1 Tax=Mya arenaria TaxID=6604 RepID=UPI0022E30349|nr:uncharacterized protein LOC128210512 [Mya arenaria]
MNETYWAYLKKEGVRKGKKCTHFALTQNDNSIVLYGRGENISFLKTNIDNSLSRLDLPNIFFRSKEGRKFLTKYKNKLTYNLMTGVVVCTQDLRDNLLQISQSSRDKMSSKGFGYYSAFVVDILQKRAGKELSRLKEEFDIDFQMNDRSITLYIEEGRSSLKKGVMDSVSKLKACTKVDLALSGLDFAQVGKVMDVHHCSWKMFSEGEMKCMGSDECRFVWMDPYRATKLSLLQIDKCTPYVDIWIELTTDELQPLGLNPNSQDHRLLSGHNRKTNDKRVGYTEVVNGPFPTSCVLAGCSMVLAIVVRADIDETNSDVIENKTLRGIFVNALEKSRHVQRNVCLNAVFAQKDPELALADVISQFIMAIDTVSKQARPEFTQKVSIIVDEKELEVAKRLIESRMSKNVMVCDKPHVFEKKTRSESHLKLMVIVGTITDSKCDAIVNTTNKRLDLSQGFVSKEISKLAGNGLKEECEQFYPNGIEEGIVAYTKSHDLKKRKKINYVFHCALPDYKSATFETNVKDTVKSCLYLAEELGCKTIAFPTLGVGNKMYPRRETASTIMKVVEDFSKAVDLSDLKKGSLGMLAFQAESWRRSEECNAPEKNAERKLSDKIVGTKTIVSTTLAIAVQDNSIKLPSFAVQVKFDKEKGCLVWKSAMEPPMTWNDELNFDAIESLQESRCIPGLLKYIDMERITFLVWNLDRDSKRSYGDQIELIANAHGRMLEQGNVYHQKAVILVPDIAAVTSFREKEKAKEESLWSWDECLDAVMVVVGPSEAHTLKANEQVAKMIEEKKKSIMRQQGPKADEEDRQVGTESILHGNGKKTLAKNTRRLFPQFRPRLIPELCGS